MFIETRQAVVTKRIFWVRGSSTGRAESVPLQQCVVPSPKLTKGLFLERRIVLGKLRLLSSPAQNGHFQRVTPSVSAAAWRTMRHLTLWLNFSS
jgi:hypothetical protein